MNYIEKLMADGLREGASISVGYMKKINEAKTSAKKRLYQKKLKKQNQKNAKLILALSQSEDKKELNNDDSN